jgi:hypothetical protein
MPKISRRRKGRRILGKRVGRNTRKMLGGDVPQLTAAFITAYNGEIAPSDPYTINESKIKIATKLAESRANMRKLIYSGLVELTRKVIDDDVVKTGVIGGQPAVQPIIDARAALNNDAAVAVPVGGGPAPAITDADIIRLIPLLNTLYNAILATPFAAAPGNRAAAVGTFAGPVSFKNVLDGIMATAPGAAVAPDPAEGLLTAYETAMFLDYTTAAAPPLDQLIAAEILKIPAIMPNNEKFIGLTAITLYLSDATFTELLNYIKLINSFDSFDLSLRMLALKIGQM